MCMPNAELFMLPYHTVTMYRARYIPSQKRSFLDIEQTDVEPNQSKIDKPFLFENIEDAIIDELLSIEDIVTAIKWCNGLKIEKAINKFPKTYLAIDAFIMEKDVSKQLIVDPVDIHVDSRCYAISTTNLFYPFSVTSAIFELNSLTGTYNRAWNKTKIIQFEMLSKINSEDPNDKRKSISYTAPPELKPSVKAAFETRFD